MDYSINPAVFSSAFAFPSEVADKYLKFCKGEHLKVLIFIMRNCGNHPSAFEIANELEISEFDVKEALLFWSDAGILSSQKEEKSNKSNTVSKILKPSREDVTKRGLEDPKLHYLLNQTQQIFGRNLKGNEMETLGWIYDDLGLDVSVILYIVQYAKQIDKANIRFIETLASDWVSKGVESLTDAEDQIRQMTLSAQAWNVVCSAFGLERRKPSKKESELSLKWINEWKISKEMLAEAYDVCIDAKNKYSFAYIAKIIENWYLNGKDAQKTVKSSAKKINKTDMQGAYNIDLFEEMIDSKE